MNINHKKEAYPSETDKLLSFQSFSTFFPLLRNAKIHEQFIEVFTPYEEIVFMDTNLLKPQLLIKTNGGFVVGFDAKAHSADGA